MNGFSERQIKIITAIANADSYITGKTLSLLLNVSVRTIQSEISEINKQLLLIHSSNKGYYIDTTNFKLCSNELSPMQSLEHLILHKLLFSDTPLHIDELADSLYISTSYLEKALHSFDAVLKKYQLNILRKKMHIKIQGNELNKRRFISYLILEESSPTFNKLETLNDYFPNINIDKIKSIIINSINKYNYYIADTYSENLIVNLTIALYRMKANYYVTEASYEDVYESSVEFKIAKEICQQYSAHLCIMPTKIDIAYMAIILMGQIKPIQEGSEVSLPSEILTSEFLHQINMILMDVFEYYMLHIDYSDYLYSFALHVKSMIKRVKSKNPSHNDILYTIKKSCPFIHDVSVQIAKKLGEIYQINIPDSEIGYISVHIGYLIENAMPKNNKIHVILLCHEYRHIAANIKRKLEENFSELIDISVIDIEDKQKISAVNADLLITTAPLNIVGLKTLCISPFYSHNDHIMIDKAIHTCLKNQQVKRYNALLSSLFNENLFLSRITLKQKLK
ncbi:BglG family transcription antiterminator [Clostridium polynesiense]|uniref:BglG family transcription antiterminator n=1 Tax=Clostridium polynesiense TaxID=1325933 RepID=UPI00058FD254|nr:PRD domain-containing protein [Clostridium polynesiense]